MPPCDDAGGRALGRRYQRPPAETGHFGSGPGSQPPVFLGCGGFTLLEILVALAILAIALTTLFGAQSQGLSLATEAKFTTNASMLAELKLAELQSGRLAPVDAHGDFGRNFPGYSWKLEVVDAGDGHPQLPPILRGRLRRVDLTIIWMDRRYRFKIRTYLRAKGAQ